MWKNKIASVVIVILIPNGTIAAECLAEATALQDVPNDGNRTTLLTCMELSTKLAVIPKCSDELDLYLQDKSTITLENMRACISGIAKSKSTGPDLSDASKELIHKIIEEKGVEAAQAQ